MGQQYTRRLLNNDAESNRARSLSNSAPQCGHTGTKSSRSSTGNLLTVSPFGATHNRPLSPLPPSLRSRPIILPYAPGNVQISSPHRSHPQPRRAWQRVSQAPPRPHKLGYDGEPPSERTQRNRDRRQAVRRVVISLKRTPNAHRQIGALPHT